MDLFVNDFLQTLLVNSVTDLLQNAYIYAIDILSKYSCDHLQVRQIVTKYQKVNHNVYP